VGDLEGKRVCVPASGDNTAVFAFHLLGARVTSTDISAEQLKNAQTIALEHGWGIEFICEDNKDNHQKHDWRRNPWAALPQWLSICVQKTAEPLAPQRNTDKERISTEEI
jgi:hypothetical protein